MQLYCKNLNFGRRRRCPLSAEFCHICFILTQFLQLCFFKDKVALPAITWKCSHASTQVENKPSPCMCRARQALTIHLALEWESDDDSDLPDEVWAENVKATKSKSQSEEWESSMANRASGRESKVGVCNERRQSMKPRSRGLGWIQSAAGWRPRQPLHRRGTVGSGSLTDLAVAEMYWTTISRFVLRSFSRSGALRSSFRFMSSWKHKRQGESFIYAREAAWMENLFQNRFFLLIVVLSSHEANVKQKQMRYTIKRTHFQFIWFHSQAKEIALIKLN